MNDNELKRLKKVVECLIKDAFARINYAYQHNKEPKVGEQISKGYNDTEHQTFTRLVFPRYSKDGKLSGDTRISEQELRFAFVEAFNKSNGVEELKLFYSIETPTYEKYSGFSPTANKSSSPKLDHNGQSGEFDLVILNEHLERVCLIEFKANNASPRDHEKDLLKLKTEGDGILRYFIEVVKAYSERDTNNSKKSEIATEDDKKNKTTIESLQEKFQLNNKDGKTIIKCYALEGKSVRNKKEGDKKGEDISDKFNK